MQVTAPAAGLDSFGAIVFGGLKNNWWSIGCGGAFVGCFFWVSHVKMRKSNIFDVFVYSILKKDGLKHEETNPKLSWECFIYRFQSSVGQSIHCMISLLPLKSHDLPTFVSLRRTLWWEWCFWLKGMSVIKLHFLRNQFNFLECPKYYFRWFLRPYHVQVPHAHKTHWYAWNAWDAGFRSATRFSFVAQCHTLMAHLSTKRLLASPHQSKHHPQSYWRNNIFWISRFNQQVYRVSIIIHSEI